MRTTARGVRGYKAPARHVEPAFRIVLLGAQAVRARGVGTRAAHTMALCPGSIMASGIINETSATNLGQGVVTRPVPFRMSEMFARHRIHTSCRSAFLLADVSVYDLARTAVVVICLIPINMLLSAIKERIENDRFFRLVAVVFSLSSSTASFYCIINYSLICTLEYYLR